MPPLRVSPRRAKNKVAPRFTSLIAAPHTPMNQDGSLALDRVPDLAAHLARSGVTGVDLPMVRFLELSRTAIPSLAGIKYTSTDLIDFQNCLHFEKNAFDILFGTDEALLAGLSLGARGAVGSTYNFAAPLYRRLVGAFESGDLESDRADQKRSVQLIETIARYGYTAAAKSVMAMIGIDCGPARPPLDTLSADGQAQLKDDLKQIGFFDWATTREP